MHPMFYDMIDGAQGTTIRITQAALEVMGKDKGGPGGALVHTASITGAHIQKLQLYVCLVK